MTPRQGVGMVVDPRTSGNVLSQDATAIRLRVQLYPTLNDGFRIPRKSQT
jgi:hypothetical protein